MAAPNKSSSRWGSFLSQAVAGVESRLDNILSEEETSNNAPGTHQQHKSQPQIKAPTQASAVLAAAKITPSKASCTSEKADANIGKTLTK